MKSLWIVALALVIAAPLPCAAAQAAISYKPLVVLSGGISRITEKRCVRVTSVQQWRELWKQHDPHGNTSGISVLEQCPEVNFDEFMVIAIFCGAATNRNGVRFVESSKTDKEIVLKCEWTGFQSSVPGFSGSPYGFIVVPKTSKALRLQFNGQITKHAEPKWVDFGVFAAAKAD